MKKKEIIIIAVLLVILLIVGILIYIKSRKESISTVSPSVIDIELPDIVQADFEYNLSTTEPTTDNVIFSITSKSKSYEIYYVIVELLETEEKDNILNIPDADYCLYEQEILIDTNSIIFLKYKDGENYSTNPFKIEITNITSSVVEDENVSEEELKNAQVNENEQRNSKYPYYIKVNYGANVVTIYKKDENNEYTVPVKAMVCSCGTATPTSGVYKTTNKYIWRPLIGGVFGQYATRIVGSILFHSVPYTSQSKDTLEYWEYDKLGTKASAGCVRLTVADAKWIYNNCSSGTMVEFYSSSNPGPLGKPSSKKISGYTSFRNWDPTDPDSNNPWIWGTPSEEQQTPIYNNQEVNNSNNNDNNNENNNNSNNQNEGENTNPPTNTNPDDNQNPSTGTEEDPKPSNPDIEYNPGENTGDNSSTNTQTGTDKENEDDNNKEEDKDEEDDTDKKDENEDKEENIEQKTDTEEVKE